MKFVNKLFIGAAVLSVAGAFTSCKEDATLSGADAVYITMGQTDISMLVGDSIPLTAAVTNASGDNIPCEVTWSVDDQSVVSIVPQLKRIKNPDYVAPEDPGSPDEGGEDTEATAAEGDESGDVTTPGDNANPEYLYEPTGVLCIKALPGSQGKQTIVRATLENGMYAMTTVTVGRNTLDDNTITAEREQMSTYFENFADTCWFDINPINVIDDYDVSYSFRMIETVSDPSLLVPGEDKFTPSAETPIFIDRENSRVGVVFQAPRLTGKAVCKLTLTQRNAEGEVELEKADSTELIIFPLITAGLEYQQNGVTVRPGPGIQTPSNIKPRLETVSLDLNSEHLVGVCIGLITSNSRVDIPNAIAAEKAGYFTWELDGSSVLAEEMFIDENYTSGYVSYLKVRSGIRTGFTRIKFTIPGSCIDSDTEPQEFLCDITVLDFNTEYPVNDVVLSNMILNEDDPDPAYHEYADNELIEAYIGTPLNIYAVTDPDASFAFHIPEVTSSDPSVLKVEARGSADGTRREFTPLKEGEVTLTFKSLDKEKSVRVKVHDRIKTIAWGEPSEWSAPETPKILVGNSVVAALDVTMHSQPDSPIGVYKGETLQWISSDPAGLGITVDPSDSRRATVSAIAAGSYTITAGIPGEYTITRTIEVQELSGIEFTDDVVTFQGVTMAFLDDLPDILELAVVTDDSRYDFDFVTNGIKVGTFAASDGSLFINGDYDNPIDGCTYNVTIVDNGDGNYTISGYFETPDGLRYTFTNLTIYG